MLHLDAHEVAKDHIEDDKHEEWFQQRPEETQSRALVTQLEVAPGQPKNQIAVPEKLMYVICGQQLLHLIFFARLIALKLPECVHDFTIRFQLLESQGCGPSLSFAAILNFCTAEKHGV